MDLNIYNIHYIVGLFGRPKNVEYYPNIERGIDTSGILVLDYDKFKCVCIGSKECKAPIIIIFKEIRDVYIKIIQQINVKDLNCY